jgi:hypothetical protein
MESQAMKQLCFKDDGALRTKNECRAVIINKLILDELMDIDEAEDLVEKSLRDWDLWNENPPEKEETPNP